MLNCFTHQDQRAAATSDFYAVYTAKTNFLHTFLFPSGKIKQEIVATNNGGCAGLQNQI
jgi:hypothetical protein